MHARFRKYYSLLALAAVAVSRAAGNEDAIARCAGMTSANDRILCLEEALRQASTDDQIADAEPVAAEQPASRAADPGPAEDAMHAAGDAAGTMETARDDTSQRIADEIAAPEPATAAADDPGVDIAAGVTTEMQTRAPRPAAAEVDTFGLSPSQLDPDPLDAIRVTVVSVDSDAFGKLIFVTESGQVWRQIDRKTARYRQLPFDAEIRTGAMGSFFIEPLTGGASVRVKRNR